jgi:transketolase
MTIRELENKANQIRNLVVEICAKKGGHVVSSLSYVDIIVALYYGGALKFDPLKPEWETRDRFILSKGHGELALYATLADLGFFPKEWLDTRYRCGDCFLGGHPDCKIPGVEVSSGSLGHGLSLACGISKASKLNNKKNRQFVLMGDAECTEGSVWEAALFAAGHSLNNLVGIVDRNRIGSLDFIENYTQLEPFADKWRIFGWEVFECDGHNINEMLDIFSTIEQSKVEKPFMLIAKTIKGKGVSFMENDPAWHVKTIEDQKQLAWARKELRLDNNSNE